MSEYDDCATICALRGEVAKKEAELSALREVNAVQSKTMAGLVEEVERLTQERDEAKREQYAESCRANVMAEASAEWQGANILNASALKRAAMERDAAEAEVAKLLEGLRPFAELGAKFTGDPAMDRDIFLEADRPNAADWERAALLAAPSGTEPKCPNGHGPMTGANQEFGTPACAACGAEPRTAGLGSQTETRHPEVTDDDVRMPVGETSPGAQPTPACPTCGGDKLASAVHALADECPAPIWRGREWFCPCGGPCPDCAVSP